MDEKCFGDFDTIEKTVLELIGAGFDSAASIAKLLGVSQWFVENIIRVLSGYGHIDDAIRITELGRNSLQSDTKITEVLTKQVISIDALTGYPINIEKSIANAEMVDFSTFVQEAYFIQSATETETAVFLHRLNSDANIRAMCKKRQVININVTNIRNAQLITTEYASAFLMCIKNVKTPVIFAQMYNPAKEVQNGRYSWQPLSIDPACMQFFDDGQTYATNTVSVNTALVGMCRDMMTKGGHENDSLAEKVLRKDIEEEFRLNPRYVTLDISRGNGIVCPEAFTEVNQKTLNMLISFAKYGVFVYTHKSIHGKVIILFPDGGISRSVLMELKQKAAEMKFKELLDLLSAERDENRDVISFIQDTIGK